MDRGVEDAAANPVFIARDLVGSSEIVYTTRSCQPLLVGRDRKDVDDCDYFVACAQPDPEVLKGAPWLVREEALDESSGMDEYLFGLDDRHVMCVRVDSDLSHIGIREQA